MSTNKTSPPDAREWRAGRSSYRWTREPSNFRGKKDCVIPSSLPETSLGGCGRDLAILWDMSLESPTRPLNESRMTHSRDCFSHRQWDPSSPPAGLQPHTAALRAMAPWRPTLSTGPQGPDMWPQKDNSLLKTTKQREHRISLCHGSSPLNNRCESMLPWTPALEVSSKHPWFPRRPIWVQNSFFFFGSASIFIILILP